MQNSTIMDIGQPRKQLAAKDACRIDRYAGRVKIEKLAQRLVHAFGHDCEVMVMRES